MEMVFWPAAPHSRNETKKKLSFISGILLPSWMICPYSYIERRYREIDVKTSNHILERSDKKILTGRGTNSLPVKIIHARLRTKNLSSVYNCV